MNTIRATPVSATTHLQGNGWRIDSGLENEGDISRLLHSHKVSHVPELLRAGDVRVLDDGGVKSFREQTGVCQPKGPPRHLHFRLAWETIGSKLRCFSSTKQLCVAMRDAITAHSVAFEKAHILHRDVSAVNVMFAPGQNGGVLVDWEMAEIHTPGEQETNRIDPRHLEIYFRRSTDQSQEAS
ncbi:hypothetical protein FA95DRAFT_966896 [Auriscalpium vulgare]|uniref:Uncharacterized protein n=1 Tax=Auriscalpium vulgare TaxID=40419 RepID=A0ACB8R704_9AGAM|nr:hypothetical protein FA95DRAFT_966896 [Auriscalpium vulgare]